MHFLSNTNVTQSVLRINSSERKNGLEYVTRIVEKIKNNTNKVNKLREIKILKCNVYYYILTQRNEMILFYILLRSPLGSEMNVIHTE